MRPLLLKKQDSAGDLSLITLKTMWEINPCVWTKIRMWGAEMTVWPGPASWCLKREKLCPEKWFPHWREEHFEKLQLWKDCAAMEKKFAITGSLILLGISMSSGLKVELLDCPPNNWFYSFGSNLSTLIFEFMSWIGTLWIFIYNSFHEALNGLWGLLYKKIRF